MDLFVHQEHALLENAEGICQRQISWPRDQIKIFYFIFIFFFKDFLARAERHLSALSLQLYCL